MANLMSDAVREAASRQSGNGGNYSIADAAAEYDASNEKKTSRLSHRWSEMKAAIATIQRSRNVMVSDEQMATALKGFRLPEQSWSSFLAEIRSVMEQSGLAQGTGKHGSVALLDASVPPTRRASNDYPGAAFSADEPQLTDEQAEEVADQLTRGKGKPEAAMIQIRELRDELMAALSALPRSSPIYREAEAAAFDLSMRKYPLRPQELASVRDMIAKVKAAGATASGSPQKISSDSPAGLLLRAGRESHI